MDQAGDIEGFQSRLSRICSVEYPHRGDRHGRTGTRGIAVPGVYRQRHPAVYLMEHIPHRNPPLSVVGGAERLETLRELVTGDSAVILENGVDQLLPDRPTPECRNPPPLDTRND